MQLTSVWAYVITIHRIQHQHDKSRWNCLLGDFNCVAKYNNYNTYFHLVSKCLSLCLTRKLQWFRYVHLKMHIQPRGCTVLLQVIRLGKIKYMALNGLWPVGHLSLFLINGKYNWNRLQSLEKNLAQCLSECGWGEGSLFSQHYAAIYNPLIYSVSKRSSIWTLFMSALLECHPIRRRVKP